MYSVCMYVCMFCNIESRYVCTVYVCMYIYTTDGSQGLYLENPFHTNMIRYAHSYNHFSVCI